MRFRPRLDTTHKAIREALEKAGWAVVSLAGVGGGCPDLLAWKGRFVLVDAKSRSKPRGDRERQTAERQAAFAARMPVIFAETPEQAVLAAEALTVSHA